MPEDIKLPEPRWFAVMHGKALYGLYDDPQAAVSTAVDLPGNDSVRVERVYTEDQVRAAVLADREGREQELDAARADANRLAAAIRAHQLRQFNSDHPLLDRRLREHDALVAADAQRAKEE
ncbi:hypothetical protein BER2_1674 [plant metagenome]|uniref:Uncharacterized protein n=1 Tax=plant metagenome TaxID=1297885 RepID=A0A484R4H0_9ZZZZ